MTSSSAQLKVGLIVETPGIDDPFDRGAYLGIERAVRIRTGETDTDAL